jgi:hypothetical protein
MWKASASSVDITPEQALPLAGIAVRTEAFSRIADRLEINGVLLEGTNQRALLLSLDTLYTGPDLRPAILNAFQDGLEEEELFLAASHTHFAPSIDPTKPGLGTVDPAYNDRVIAQAIELVRQLFSLTPVEVEIRHQCHNAAYNMNRRKLPLFTRPGAERCEAGPNPRAPRDERLRRMDLVDTGGSSIATLWHYACHPVGYPDQDAVSADFPGVGRATLRAIHGAAHPVLFFQGFSGDLRPRVIEPHRDLVRKIFKGPLFGHFSNAEWDSWSTGLAASLPAERAQALVDCSGSLRMLRSTMGMETFCNAEEALPPLSLQGIRMGEVQLLGVSAEVMAAYGIQADDQTWAIGCMDHTFGYFPTDAMLGQGGYEVSGFQEDFGLDIAFKPGSEAALREALRSICESR